MSFSSTVKEEILAAPEGERHCRLALASAIIAGGAKIEIEDGKSEIRFKSESVQLINKFHKIYTDDYNQDTEKFLTASGLWSNETGYTRRINRLMLRNECCRRAYLSGTLMACGYISDPHKGYHAEFQTGGSPYARELVALLNGFELTPLILSRKGRNGPVLYFKDGEQIAELLKLTGAHMSLMSFEDTRILKSIGNHINRGANFDAANVDKSISAAVRQIESINLIKQVEGLGSLPPGLEELARLRLDYPEMSLKEIGERLNPPVSKSGVNHRLRKLKEIANKIANKLEV